MSPRCHRSSYPRRRTPPGIRRTSPGGGSPKATRSSPAGAPSSSWGRLPLRGLPGLGRPPSHPRGVEGGPSRARRRRRHPQGAGVGGRSPRAPGAPGAGALVRARPGRAAPIRCARAPGGAAPLLAAPSLRADDDRADRAAGAAALCGRALPGGGGRRPPGHQAVEHHHGRPAAPDRPERRPHPRGVRAADVRGRYRRLHGARAVPARRPGEAERGERRLGHRSDPVPGSRWRAAVRKWRARRPTPIGAGRSSRTTIRVRCPTTSARLLPSRSCPVSRPSRPTARQSASWPTSSSPCWAPCPGQSSPD